MTTPTHINFIHPPTGEIFGKVQANTNEDVVAAVHDMRISFHIWSQRTPKQRARVLRRFQGLLIDRVDEIARVVSQNTGKSMQDGLAEVFMTVDLLNHYTSKGPGWLAPEKLQRGIVAPFKQAYMVHKPYGVVGILAPWNYPFNLSMSPVISALMAGNTVVLKPSELAPAVGDLIDQLFRSSPELAPFVRVVHGDGQLGAALVDAKPNYIFLTGSVETAKKVALEAAKELIPCGFELGGKDATIVLEDADLAAAARWSVWGAFYNSGQTCMGVERVYVVEPVYDAFVRHVLVEAASVRYGYAYDRSTPFHYGSMTCDFQASIVQEHITDAVEKGAVILAGGRRHGMFIEPTVLTNVNHDMLVMRDETFGPVLPIMKVKNEREAIRYANDNQFGLGGSIWSSNHRRAERVASKVQAGAMVVNDAVVQFALSPFPFGGIKNSGNSRSHGKNGLLTFTQPYSYLVGSIPMPFDPAVILREPGRYDLAKSILQVAFGINLRQKTAPLQTIVHTWTESSQLNTLAHPHNHSKADHHHQVDSPLLGLISNSKLNKLALAAIVIGSSAVVLGTKKKKPGKA